MIIIKFCSGLGNQLFQYALYRNLQIKYPNQRVLADISVFEDINKLNAGNGFSYGFALEKYFNININKATRDEISSIEYEVYLNQKVRKYLSAKICNAIIGNSVFAKIRAQVSPKYKVRKKNYISAYPANAFNGKVYNLADGDYSVSGLWQNIDYFEDIKSQIRVDLSFRNTIKSKEGEDLLKKIKSSASVMLHVRKGDYTNSVYNDSHNICGFSYYRQAIEIVKSIIKNPEFYVFTDDVEKCKNMFQGIKDLIYVSGTENLSFAEEMILATECKHAIISNSTFAFWMAWIGDTKENRVVVRPKYMEKQKDGWREMSAPQNWLVVDNLSRQIKTVFGGG